MKLSRIVPNGIVTVNIVLEIESTNAVILKCYPSTQPVDIEKSWDKRHVDPGTGPRIVPRTSRIGRTADQS
jgi:hypothetical protein